LSSTLLKTKQHFDLAQHHHHYSIYQHYQVKICLICLNS